MSGILNKKPKREIIESMEENDDTKNNNNNNNNNNNGESVSNTDEDKDEEEALIALYEHRSKEVQQNKTRVAYYQSQLEQAERSLRDTEAKLVRVRRRISDKLNRSIYGAKQKVKVEHSPRQTNEDSPQRRPQSKPQLLISNADHKSSRPTDIAETATKAPPRNSDSPMKGRGDKSHRTPPEPEVSKSQAVGEKRKLERKEHKELISLVCSSSSPSTIRCSASTHISSQHKRKLRSLALCPVNDNLFITSSLDGMVHLWQLQAKGSGATFLSSTDCLSPKQRRWPEDITWHPEGNRLVAAYSADGGDNQISVLNLNKSQSARVTFLQEKPHVKGIINNISFMPWDDVQFVTAGSDHAVVFWNENEDTTWKPKALHRNVHSSAVMGVAGLRHKQMVVSAGADKRIIGYDVLAGRVDYRYQIESKCMSVVPNPCDFNLFMVQTGTPERQLRLFDIRLRNSELHAIGWKQESSESQSALINQAWSPDGLYITSGTVDPMIHIFDIRYNSHKPSQSLKVHQKRVFKAEWHSSLPLLVSISSDLQIGLHKI